MESKNVTPAAITPAAITPGSGTESASDDATGKTSVAGAEPDATDREAGPVITAGQARSADAKADDGGARGSPSRGTISPFGTATGSEHLSSGITGADHLWRATAARELIETRYADSRLAIQGLLRGEVSLLTRVPLSAVRELQTRSELSVLPYALAETHLLQFRPGLVPLSNRALRRAISYAIPRQTILDTQLVRRKTPDWDV